MNTVDDSMRRSGLDTVRAARIISNDRNHEYFREMSLRASSYFASLALALEDGDGITAREFHRRLAGVLFNVVRLRRASIDTLNGLI